MVEAADVVSAAEELVLLSVALLIVVFLSMVVPVAAPLAPVPTTPVPTAPVPKAPPAVVVALLAATVVVAELFRELIADWRIALAEVGAEVVAVRTDEEVAEDVVLAVEPPERVKRPE